VREFALPPRSDRPFYRSLARAIREAIDAGRLQAGDHLPSQQEIARAARVNVATVSRAINLLVREHVLTKHATWERAVVASNHLAADAPDDGQVAGPGRIRLRVHVKSIRRRGATAEVTTQVIGGQEVVVSTTEASIGWLELRDGQAVVVDIASPSIGLSNQ